MEYRKKNIFIILSVIHFKDTPLSYSDTRSVFNAEDRLLQTEKTINSIRNKVPHAQIVFIEMGTVSVAAKIQPLVDIYIYMGNKKLVRYATDSKFKGLGEAVGLLYTIPILKKIDVDFIFKISGRYFLNDHFSLSEWINENKCRFLLKDGSFSTRLYSIPKKNITVWKHALLKSVPFLLQNESIEFTMKRFMPKTLTASIITAGVSGIVAPTGAIIEE